MARLYYIYIEEINPNTFKDPSTDTIFIKLMVATMKLFKWISYQCGKFSSVILLF